MFNLFSKKDEQKEETSDIEFTWQPRIINDKGTETIDDMSFIKAPYLDYLITKTGNLVGMIEISGVNLELLNNEEQKYVFEVYNTFLRDTLGDNSDETQQYLDMTMSVQTDEYLLSYKKRYLKEEHPERKRLIASYIHDMQKKTEHNEMSTKKHILILKEPIKENTLSAVENSSKELDEKIRNYIKNLEDSFEQYDVQAKKLFADEVKKALKNQMNFNGR